MRKIVDDKKPINRLSIDKVLRRQSVSSESIEKRKRKRCLNKPVGLKITDQEIDNLWWQTGCEPTTHRIHTGDDTQRCKWVAAHHRCGWMAQSNTSNT